ncbi:2-isopropylmalate synthase [Neomoorella glycerini]|uniref:2-isopropylmalate synthase n=1 Tax=Neomoorella glycerini TaxID=55779 RepID=A0A6I5ZPH5_9FIRM|nr:3-hydroxy-3-methylglutaryl-CoA lyase [Moorella glycerini]QGP91515.1 2-isopropylmalate synthase [Moorella glycerini]
MQEPWHRDKWWVSEYNFAPPVREQQQLPEKIIVHDATLRDGEQTPGVVFRLEEKVAIARMLDELGVDRIEAGMPAVSDEDAAAIREIVQAGLKARIMAFSRAMLADIDRAAACGVWGIILEVPTGYPKLRYQFNWTEDEIIAKSITAINYAHDRGLYVTFFPFDTTRARMDFLKCLFAEVMRKATPDSIAVVDTTGSATPAAMGYLVREIKKMVSVPLEVHTHNDLGLGTATTLAAVEAGAEVVHGCINGLGERAGNTALEEVLLCLAALYGYQLKVDLSKLATISMRVAEIARQPLAGNKPVVGSLPFTREIGLGMEVLQKSPLAIFPFLPETVGKKMEIVMGKKTGKGSVRVKLEEMGRRATEEEIEAIVQRVKALGIAKKGILTQEEFEQIVKGVLNDGEV